MTNTLWSITETHPAMACTPAPLTCWLEFETRFFSGLPSQAELLGLLDGGFDLPIGANYSGSTQNEADERMRFYLRCATGWRLDPWHFRRGEEIAHGPADKRAMAARRDLARRAFEVLVQRVFEPAIREPKGFDMMAQSRVMGDVLIFFATHETESRLTIPNLGFAGRPNWAAKTARAFVLRLLKIAIGIECIGDDLPPKRIRVAHGVVMIRILDALGELKLLEDDFNWHLLTDAMWGELRQLAYRPVRIGHVMTTPKSLIQASAHGSKAAATLETIEQLRLEELM